MIFENRLKRCVTRIRGEEAGTGKSRLSAPGVGTYVRAWRLVTGQRGGSLADQRGERWEQTGLERRGPGHVGPALQNPGKALDFIPDFLGSHWRALSSSDVMRTCINPAAGWKGHVRRHGADRGLWVWGDPGPGGSGWAVQREEERDLLLDTVWTGCADGPDVWCDGERGIKGDSKAELAGSWRTLWWRHMGEWQSVEVGTFESGGLGKRSDWRYKSCPFSHKGTESREPDGDPLRTA